MKKILAVLASALMVLSAGGCATSNAEYYERAQLYLGCGDYATAATLFSQLGEFEDAAEYALYCAGLQALAQGNRVLARANLEQVDPFKSSFRYLRYMDAADLESEGDLEGALAIYQSLGSFEDSADQTERLRAAIPERYLAHAKALMKASRWEQALGILEGLDGYGDSAAMIEECQESITQAAYDRAQALYNQGDYGDAMAAFEALGDTLDAKARALMCRSAMYQALERDYAAATLDTAESLMARFAEMEDYLESPARLASLERRYATNLTLLSAAYARPYVTFGRYATGESGLETPLTWRVVGVEDHQVNLLCEQVLDAMTVASATDFPLQTTTAEAEGVVSVTLPSRESIASLPESDLPCEATPYALAQGVRHHSDGHAWWWLADVLTDGRHPIIWYNGTTVETGVDPAENSVGVRPLLTLSLDDYSLTEGSGTPEDPFR